MLLKALGKAPSHEAQTEYEKRTTLFQKGRFHNFAQVPLMAGKRSKRAADRIPPYSIPVIKQNSIPEPGEDLTVYWLGHSSILLQIGRKNVLIDPVLSRYSSPFNWIGVKRFSKIPILPTELPDIDLVLLSHDHYDHLDYPTIMAIKDKVGHFVVPLGVEASLQSWGIEGEKITSLSWWENAIVDHLEITATPAQHFSNRNPLHSNASWWCGFCLTNHKRTVYYSGDGGYSDSFKEIGERFSIDLAFLECGQYDAAWPNCHMFPEQTALAAKDLRARWCIPVHWGAFCLCNSSWNDSVIRFSREAERMEIQLATPLIGEMVSYEKIGEYKKAWYY